MGSPATDHRKRQEIRRRLEAQGVPAEEIARVLERKRAEQDARRAALSGPSTPATAAERRQQVKALHEQREATYDATYRRITGDDRAFRPTKPDPITTGQARATGATAKAARRGRTYTKWEIEQMGAAG